MGHVSINREGWGQDSGEVGWWGISISQEAGSREGWVGGGWVGGEGVGRRRGGRGSGFLFVFTAFGPFRIPCAGSFLVCLFVLVVLALLFWKSFIAMSGYEGG